MSKEIVHEAFLMLSGAVTIVYPMGLPPYDPIQAELKNEEDLSGTHVRVTAECMAYLALKAFQ